MIDANGLHGRLVRLGPALDTPLTAHDYPEPVAVLLGEALALVSGLSAGLKFSGVFSLQARGDGPVKLVVADVTTDGAIRGYADVKDDIPDGVSDAPIPRLLGAGRLAFTVDQGPDTEQHQGIVDLQGANLADCVHHYFQQSSQYTAAVKLACCRDAENRWRGGAIILQRLPEDENPFERDKLEEGWRTALTLMGSCTPEELCDPDLAPDRLLFRLFHEDGVRVFPARPLKFACNCSRDRMQAAVSMLSDVEREEMTIDGRITVTCQFCNAEQIFDPLSLEPVHTA
ncbi:MAG: molecular chaperone Hsp33 [Alphaproteobacteria bacterium]|nr:molecular chaperone Hsp33 [Alphaproteobacteria bacterium]